MKNDEIEKIEVEDTESLPVFLSYALVVLVCMGIVAFGIYLLI